MRRLTAQEVNTEATMGRVVRVVHQGAVHKVEATISARLVTCDEDKTTCGPAQE